MASPKALLRHLTVHLGWVTALQLITVTALVWWILIPQMGDDIRSSHRALARSVFRGSGGLSKRRRSSDFGPRADFIRSRGDQSGEDWNDFLDAQCGRGTFFEAIYLVDLKKEKVVSIGLPQRRRRSREDLLGLDLSGPKFSQNRPGKPMKPFGRKPSFPRPAVVWWWRWSFPWRIGP